MRDWFEPKFDHPFASINIMTIPEATKSIPHKWVEDVQIDDLFRGDDLDVMGTGGPPSTWGPEEGHQRLLAALRRLDLTEDRVAHPNLERMGKAEFAAEKRRVKQELK